jgi:hypothetical protein
LNQRMSLAQVLCAALAVSAVLTSTPVAAQVTPAGGPAPPDDTPSIRVGATIYTDYSYQTDPKITDADGNLVHRSGYDVKRSYININGSLSHIVAFRITPDIARETSSTSSLNGSLQFRIKYAFLQANLDDWMTRGSWARFGIQQTPYVDFAEGIYRYRFQGTMFVERTGYMSSSDAGASFHYNLPLNYGDVHVGYYNGENYNRAEVNDQKGLMIRATGRPFARKAPILRGLRGHVFHVSDHYVKDGERRRTVGTVSYEHPSVVAAFEYLDARDRRSALPGIPSVHGKGYSVWVTPRTKQGWEGLFRYDHLTPDTSSAPAPFVTAGNFTTPLESQRQDRVIVGVAYWFKLQGSVTASLLVDYDGQIFKNLTTPEAKTVAVHALVNF